MQKSIWARAIIGLTAGIIMAGCSGDDQNKGSKKSETPVVSIASMEISEGSRGPREVKIPVTLSVSAPEEVRVQFETVDGTARAGEDYHVASGEITIPRGGRRGEISITIIGDTKHEPDETFEIHLLVASGAKIDPKAQTARITIKDDDAPPTVAFSAHQQLVAESVGETLVHLHLEQESGFTVEVPFSISGTARVNDDYIIKTPSPLVWQPGETSKSITVQIIEDDIPEGGETIWFRLGEPKHAVLPKAEREQEHIIIIAGDVALNDTGVRTFSNETHFNLPIEPSSHPGQDAAFGRDTTDADPSDGAAGFSFTKLDEHGNPLPSSAPEWACVRDNVTGLVWENKQPPLSNPEMGPIWRASSYVYTWYNDDKSNNGGSVGVVNDKLNARKAESSQCAYQAELPGMPRPFSLHCNTQTYAQEANYRGLCGFHDWRVPTVQELRSIVNYDPTLPHALPDPDFFPHTTISVPYFSSTPAADSDASVWCLSAGGDVQLCNKSTAAAIRLVRKGE